MNKPDTPLLNAVFAKVFRKETVAMTDTDDEMAEQYTALNGVLALMNKGLNDLAEV